MFRKKMSYLCRNQGAYGLVFSIACVSESDPSLAFGLTWRITKPPYSGWIIPEPFGRLWEPIMRRSLTDWLNWLAVLPVSE